MRFVWVALVWLAALAGGAATGYRLNLDYGPRTSLRPLHIRAERPLEITVRRLKFVVGVARPSGTPRRTSPGIVDITPPEALTASLPSPFTHAAP